MFAKRERLRIVNEFLDATGEEVFKPHAFLEWLKPQEGHPVWATFFGMDDADAAEAYRASLVRRWVSDLRIVVRYSPPKTTVVTVQMVTVPAFVSPMAGRRGGGGYERVAGDDPEQITELRMQAADALRVWRERYGGVLTLSGGDPVVIENVAAHLEGNGREGEVAA